MLSIVVFIYVLWPSVSIADSNLSELWFIFAFVFKLSNNYCGFMYVFVT